MPPEQFKPSDDDRGRPDHRIDGLEGLLAAGPNDLFDQEFEIGLDRTEIDVLGITSRHGWVVIVWHAIDRPTSWLTTGYDEGRCSAGERNTVSRWKRLRTLHQQLLQSAG